jgi:hypothetical protein
MSSTLPLTGERLTMLLERMPPTERSGSTT